MKLGLRGEAVRDLQRRLESAGFAPGSEEPGWFCAATETAVRAFQAAHGLPPDGVCDTATWMALVEASWDLGDRLLAYRTPMMRGDDVADLQRLLGRLGFDAGRVDGMFGPLTAVALADFQRNSGLHPDGICGFETLQAIRRVSQRTGTTPVATVREGERLRQASPRLTDQRVVVGRLGGLGSVCRAVTKSLRRAGAQVIALDEPDATVQAAAANRFEAHLYLGLNLTDGASSIAYYAVTGFESVGGRRLAELLHDRLVPELDELEPHAKGLRLPVLRETRMPAVLVTLGPVQQVTSRSPQLAAAIAGAVEDWVTTPLR